MRTFSASLNGEDSDWNENPENLNPNDLNKNLSDAEYSHENSLSSVNYRIKKENSNEGKSSKLVIIIIIISILIIGLGIGAYLFFKSHKKKEPEIEKEKLVATLKWTPNQVYFYNDFKSSTTTLDLGEGRRHSTSETFLTDFSLSIYGYDEKTDLFKAILVISNMTMDNGTEANFICGLPLNSDESDSEEEGEDESKSIEDLTEEEKEKYKEQINSQPIIDFSFFSNGTINKIEIPSKIGETVLSTMTDFMDKVIPGLSMSLYSVEPEKELRALEEGEIFRNFTQDNETTYLIEEETKGVKSEDGMIKMDKSSMNSTKDTEIDNELGAITNIDSLGSVLLESNDNYDKYDHEYPEGSPITNEDTKDDKTNEARTDFKSMETHVDSSIVLNGTEINQKLIEKILLIKNEIEMVDYNNSIQTNNTLRILRQLSLTEDKILKRNYSEIKHFKNKESIRGLKITTLDTPLEFSYSVFKADLVGFQMTMDILLLAEGEDTTLNIVLNVGETKVVLYQYSLNIGINDALNMAGQLTSGLIDKVSSLFSGVNSKKDGWLSNFMDFIKNISNKLVSVYDISHTYKQPMTELYNTITSFTKNLFSNLGEIIQKAQEKINELKNKISSNFDKTKEVVGAVNGEYSEYIEAMFSIVDIFFEKSKSFIGDISSLADKLENFSVDLYYDLIDRINDTKGIFVNFVDNLFNGVTKGIESFEEKAMGLITKSMGKILDIIEFIADSLENSEILALVVPEDMRTKMISGLRNFRTSIESTLSVFIQKVKDDFLSKIDISQIDSIRSNITAKLDKFAKEFENLSDGLINNLKAKLKNFDKFEIYTNLLDNFEGIETGLFEKINVDFKNYFILPKNGSIINIDDFNGFKNNLKNGTDKIEKLFETQIETLINKMNEQLEEDYNNYAIDISKIITKIKPEFEPLFEILSSDFEEVIDYFASEIKNCFDKNLELSLEYLYEYYERVTSAKSLKHRTPFYMRIESQFIDGFDQLLKSLNTSFEDLLKTSYLNLADRATQIITHSLNIHESVNRLSSFKKSKFLENILNQLEEIGGTAKEIFTEDNFKSKYSSKISKLLSELNTYGEKTKSTYNGDETKKKVDEWEICEYEKGDYCAGAGGNLTSRNNLDFLITTLYDYLFEDKIYSIISPFSENTLLITNPLKNITDQIVDRALTILNYNTNDMGELSNLLNEYGSFIDQFFEKYFNKDSLTQILSNLGKVYSEKLDKFFSEIAEQINQFNSTFLTNHLTKNISSLFEYPSEIITKVGQISKFYSEEGKTIISKVKTLILKEVEEVLGNIVNSALSAIDSDNNKINLSLENCGFSVFASARTYLIYGNFYTLKSKVSSFLSSIKEDSIEKTYNISLGNIIDFDGYTKKFENNILGNYNNISSQITKIIEDKFKDFNSTIDNNFQTTKLRSGIKFIENIIDTVKKFISEDHLNILKADSFIEELQKFGDFKVFDIYNQINDYLSELKKSTLEELSPFINGIKDTMTEIFSQAINKDLIDFRTNEFLRYVCAVPNFIEDILDEIPNKFTSLLKTSITKELSRLKTLKNIELYYFNETAFNKSYYEIKNELVGKLDDILNITSNFNLDEKFISDVTKKYKSLLDGGVNQLYEIFDKVSKNFVFKTLNYSLSLKEIAQDAVENKIYSIFDEIIINVLSKFENAVPKLIEILTDKLKKIKTEVEEEIDYQYNDFFNVMKKFSISEEELVNITEQNNLVNNETDLIEVNIVTSFSQEFLDNKTEIYSNLFTEIEEIFSQNYFNELIKNNTEEYLDLLNLVIDSDTVEEQIKEYADKLIESCKMKLETDIQSFAEYIKEILTDKLCLQIDEFSKGNAISTLNTIIYKLNDNYLLPAIDKISSKINEIDEFFNNIFNGTKTMVETSKVAFQVVYSELSNKILNEINTKTNFIIVKGLNTFSGTLAEKMGSIISKVIMSNKLISEKFGSEVLGILNSTLSDTVFLKNLTTEFETIISGNLISPAQEKIKESINSKLEETKKYLSSKESSIKDKIGSILTEVLPEVFGTIANKLLDFKGIISEQIGSSLFSLTDKAEKLITDFIDENIPQIFEEIENKYDEIENKIFGLMDEKISQFKDLLSEVKEKLPTTTIKNQIQGFVDKANGVLTSINDYIIGFINELEEKIFDLLFNNKKRNLRDKNLPVPLRKNDVLNLDVKELVDTVKNMLGLLDSLKKTFSSLKETVNLVGYLSTFKDILTKGIAHIKDPVEEFIKKLKTFLVPNTLQKFKEKIDNEIKEIVAIATNHFKEIPSPILNFIDRIKEYPQQLLTNIKDKLSNTVYDIRDKAIVKILTYIKKLEKTYYYTKPVNVLDCYIPLYGLALHFQIGFDLGLGYGFGLAIRKNYIYLEAFGSAKASIHAEALLSAYALEFGAGIYGLLGSGDIGIAPSYSIKSLRIGLDAFIRLTAFAFDINVVMKYPIIKIKWIKKKVLGVKVKIPLTSVTMGSEKFGGIAYKGLKFEKHILKDV